MKKRFAFIMVLCIVMTVLCTPAFADEAGNAFVAGFADGQRDGSLFAAGNETGSGADVRGLLFTAGYNVLAAGNSEYTLAAGYDVDLNGNVENDAFAAGNYISVGGNVARDLFAAGNSVMISGEVGRNLYVAANTVTIDGTVKGELYISAENLIIDGTAEVGRLHFNGDANVSAPADAIASAETYEPVNIGAPSEALEAPAAKTAGSKILDALISWVGVAAAAFALLWLTPLWEKLDTKYYGAPFGSYAKAFGIGFAVLVALPVAAVILMITRIGIRAALVLLFVYAAAIAVSPVFISFFVGALIWRRGFKKDANLFVELPVGALVWRAALFIPGLGFVVGLVASALGLGVITLLLGKGETQNIPALESAETAGE